MAKDKFTRHQVVRRVGYGVGVQLALNPTQIHDRLHALVVDDEKLGHVTVAEPIEFRPGEVIGIAHTPSRHEAEALQLAEKGKKVKTPANPASPDANMPNTGEPDPNAAADDNSDEDEGDADEGDDADAGDADRE